MGASVTTKVTVTLTPIPASRLSSLQPRERTVSSTTGTGLVREKEGKEAATEAKHV